MGIFYSTVYAEGGSDRMSALRKLAYRALVYFHYSAATVYIASQKLIRYEFSFSSSLVSRRQFSVYSDKDLRGCQTQLVRLRCSVLAQPPQDVLSHALASVGALSLSNPYGILLWLPRVLRWYSQTSRTLTLPAHAV